MKDILAYIAAGVAILSVIPYITDVIRKRTKPNIVTWFTWTVLTGVATAAAWSAGEHRAALLIGASTLCTAAVVVAGVRYGIARLSWFDGLCQLGAIIGLGLWLVFKSPTIGIVVPVTIDFIVMLPTLRHAWLAPAEETWQTFVLSATAALLTVLSLSNWTLNGLLYPVYLLAANSLIVAAVIIQRRRSGISLTRVVRTTKGVA